MKTVIYLYQYSYQYEFKVQGIRKFKVKISFQEKFNYLYNAIPEEMAIKTNLISQKTSWEDTTKHLIETLHHLKRLKEKRNKDIQQENVEMNYITKKDKVDNKIKYHKKNKPENRKHEIKCWNCGRKGHYREDCKQKNKKFNNNYNRGKRYEKKERSMGDETVCQNNESSNNNDTKKEDKHQEYFFADYNDAYEIESSNVSGILPFKDLKYFKTPTCENKINNNDNTNKRK